LAVLEEKQGTTEEAMGNAKVAKQHYESALKLTLSAPKTTTTKAAAAILQGRLSKVSAPDQAITHATLQAETFSRLTAQDPLNLLWKRQHATAFQQLGATLEAVGKLTEAIASYRQASEILCSLPDSGNQSQNLNRERAATHLRLAAALFKAKSDKEAKEQASESLRCMSGLQMTPEIQQWKRTAEALVKE
jgi:tetratricopeptide (TPR) repeat protein